MQPCSEDVISHAPTRTSSPERRVLFVMLGTMACQAWGLIAMLHAWRVTAILRLFAFRAAAAPGWLLAAATLLAYVYASGRSLPYIRERFFDITGLKLLAVPFSFGAGLVEELLFRRLLMDALAHGGHGAAVQVGASAVAFGFLHATFGLFAGSMRAIVAPVIWTTALGAALALAYLLGGRDLAPCLWAHSLIDLAIEPWLLLAVTQRARRSEQATS